MRSTITTSGVCLAAVLSLAEPARAQSGSAATMLSRSTTVGLKAGLITSGTIYVEDGEFDSDASYSIGGFLDYRLAPKLFGGISVDAHNISAFDEEKMLVDAELTLKALVAGATGRVAVRPGLGIGYGTVGAISGVAESSQYLTVRGFAEVLVPLGARSAWLGEVAVLAGPSGGNSDLDITFGPMLLVRGGFVF